MNCDLPNQANTLKNLIYLIADLHDDYYSYKLSNDIKNKMNNIIQIIMVHLQESMIILQFTPIQI